MPAIARYRATITEKDRSVTHEFVGPDTTLIAELADVVGRMSADDMVSIHIWAVPNHIAAMAADV